MPRRVEIKVEKLKDMIISNYRKIETMHQDICDVTFLLNDGKGEYSREYKCNKFLFAINSPYFKSMLYGSMREGQGLLSLDEGEPIILNEISCEGFEYVRDCFYLLKPKINENIAFEILQFGNKILSDPLKIEAERFIVKNIWLYAHIQT